MFAEQRTEHSFKAIINPIWEEMQNQFVKNHQIDFTVKDRIPCTKTDRYNWGRTQQFIDLGKGSSDFIDASDIIITIPVKKKNCLTNTYPSDTLCLA